MKVREKSTTHPQYVLRSSLEHIEGLRHNTAQGVVAEATEDLAEWWAGVLGVRGHGDNSDPLHFVYTYCHFLEFHKYNFSLITLYISD